jgi:hypothetical protein
MIRDVSYVLTQEEYDNLKYAVEIFLVNFWNHF